MFKAILFVLFAFVFFNKAWAACEYSANQSAYRGFISFGLVTVDPNLPVGSTLAQKVLQINDSQTLVVCSGPIQLDMYGIGNYSALAPGFSDVYQTNLAGIGFRFGEPPNAAPLQISLVAPTNQGYFFNPATVSLIKTASGIVDSGVLAVGGAIFATFGGLNVFQFDMSSSTIQASACSPQGSSIVPVTLGDWETNSFTGIGSTSQPTNFTISFNCNADISMRFQLRPTNGSVTPSQGLMNLSADSTANGVGIQVFYAGSPALLEESLDGPSTGTQRDLNFSASYYQTEGLIEAGSAKGSMTLDLVYQ